MKKNLFYAVVAIGLLASCTSDEYLGEVISPTTSNDDGAIQFVSETPSITRTSDTDAAKLHYKFKVFGVKTVNDADQRVFATNQSGVTPYDVWFETSSTNKTSSNSSNWEYVGAAGEHGVENYEVTLSTDQTIKYWDYSASAYNFQAWSDLNETPIAFSSIDKNTMSFTANATQLGNLYISDLITISSPDNNTDKTAINKYGGIVQFTFRKAAAKVRLGIYETIPGYVVRKIKFYYNSGNSSNTERAHLTGSFIGSTTSNATFNVRYDGDPQKAVLETSGDASNRDVFDFGPFDSSNGIGTSSSSPTWANPNAENYYSYVFPNTTNIGPMTLTVDYELYNPISEETIQVSGATAVVPATYMTWNPNYAYTYLFKISDNTNGSTGQSVVGLYPITFDAVIVATDDGTQGTVTTVSTPSITCYQDGNVYDGGIQFVAGKDIEIRVSEISDIEIKRLSGDFDYTKTYEAQDYDGASASFTSVTEATLTNAVAKTYVIKATTATATAYFVLVVGQAEVGPTNPTTN